MLFRSEELGIPAAHVQVEEGDTDTAPYGLGTYASRSTPTSGAACALAARKIRDKARKLAAHLLEVSENDLEWEPGKFSVKGAPQIGVADRVHGLVQGAGVVAAVVLPAEGRLVRELLRLDEVLHAQLGRVHVEFLRERVGGALDRVHRLGDAEGTAVRHAPGRLVRIGRIDLEKACFKS